MQGRRKGEDWEALEERGTEGAHHVQQPPAQPHRHRVGLPALAGSPPGGAGVRHRLDQGTEECAKGLGVSGLRNAAKSFELP